jgi:hypothetical protein
MIYAQFYQMSVAHHYNAYKSRPVEACGDRAVVIYDARLRLADVVADARQECAKRGFVGFAMMRGESFSRARQISPLQLEITV